MAPLARLANDGDNITEPGIDTCTYYVVGNVQYIRPLGLEFPMLTSCVM